MARQQRRARTARARSARWLLVAAALACAPTTPGRRGGAAAGDTSRAGAAPHDAPLFVPEAVHVYLPSAFLVRRDEAVQLSLPFRQPAAPGRGRTEAFAVGERGVEALRITGPRAHEVVLPLAGAAMPGWEKLRIDTATGGRFTATPVWRRRADGGPALDSVAVAVERLVFPGVGALRAAPVTRPALVPPP
jgi:hypothetical protein